MLLLLTGTAQGAVAAAVDEDDANWRLWALADLERLVEDVR